MRECSTLGLSSSSSIKVKLVNFIYFFLLWLFNIEFIISEFFDFRAVRGFRGDFEVWILDGTDRFPSCFISFS